MTLRLELLTAPITLAYAGQRHVLPAERRTQFVVWLVLRRGWVARAEIAALLWPDQPQEAALRNLRKTLFRLRGAPWAVAVEQQGGALRCDAQTDLHDFEQALAVGRIDAALRLSAGGELLRGLDDDANPAWSAWLAFERERHRSAWRGAALQRLQSGQASPAEGIELAAALLRADPLDEAAMAQQLAWLARGGQTALARERWQEHAERLRSELGVAPGAELQELQQRLAQPVQPVPPVAPAASAPAAAATPASTVDDGFVGRSAELRRIEALLGGGECRLLTLLGPGGSGKTRLARRAAERLAPRFADGVTWLALEDATTPEAVGRALAQALALRLAGGTPLVEQLVAALAPQRRLLVLDNVEQLAGQAAQLEPLLAGCPGVALLVTSRERLKLAAEQVLPLAGLPCPEPEDAAELEQFDAARLFVQAARRADPGFSAAREAAGIVDICRHVGGLPLALEMAAAWTRLMPCEAIAAELARSVELLASSDPSRPARQASIEAVFEHSWQLLADTERAVLARLALFRGGFTADAARSVAEAPWPVLGALADKSLLRKEGMRLALHPLVGQLARARLAADAEAAAARHARHFVQLLAQLSAAVKTGDRAALQQLDAEWDNVVAAWPVAVRLADAGTLRAALATLRGFGDHRTRWADVLALLADPAEPDWPPTALPALRALRAHLTYRLDRFDDAMAIAESALADETLHADPLARLQCQTVLGTCHLRLNRLAEARRHYREVLARAPRVDPRLAAQTLDNLALVEKRLGRFDASLRMSNKALEQFQRLGDAAGAALCMNNIGSLELDLGRLDDSRRHMEAALATAERHGLAHTRLLASVGLAQLETKLRRFDAARAHGERALAAALAAANPGVVSTVQLVLAEAAIRSQRLDTAREMLASGLREAMALQRPPLIWFGLTLFGQLLLAAGETAVGLAVHGFVLQQPGVSAGERAMVHDRLADAGHEPAPATPWRGPPLDALLQRIVGEAAQQHAALIAELRGP